MKAISMRGIARELFRAISYILIRLELHREDEKYIILQLCRHYVYYYRYFEYLDKDQFSEANLYAVKAETAKKNVITFLEQKYTYYCKRHLDGIFGIHNWEHCILQDETSHERTMSEG